MTCENCHQDHAVTTTWTWTVTRIDSRTGKETVERRSKRLCVACGPGEQP
jgi:hypothetical protein